MKPIPPKKILLLGADGFIGRHLAFHFRNSGFEVLCSARRVTALERMGFAVFKADLYRPDSHDKAYWQGAVRDVDYVVNAAGLLTGSNDQFNAVHVLAPAAVYAALPSTARGVLISAVGTEAETLFAKFRRMGEAAATNSALPFTILRPGLVLGDTSYGGSSLLRALAAFPFAIPVIGKGDTAFNPIHATDLAEVVLEALQSTELQGCFEIGGAEEIEQAALFRNYRRWLGIPPARLLHIPWKIAGVLGRIGDFLSLGPISATSIKQLEGGVLADNRDILRNLKFHPRGVSEFLAARPAGTQDIWQARLYLLRPALRFGLALMWLVSGLLGVFLPASQWIAHFGDTGLSEPVLVWAARLGGLVDLAIAAGLVRNWRPARLGRIQLVLVLAYTIGLSFIAPQLWLDPFGGLLKNLPVLLAIMVWIELEHER
ncbi:MAG: SDR family oxidoreductase [Alphaproteobacteria bacterium]|nr:SDR family oxidoreductase [Alphaproteobacteria bacterium]